MIVETVPSAQPNDNHVGWDPGKGVEVSKTKNQPWYSYPFNCTIIG